MGNNSHKPAIRFQGFTDAWEQRKYGDVMDLLSGQDFAPSDYNDEGFGMPYMTGASCIQNGQTMEMRWTPVPKCIAEKGDVLLVCKGSGYGTLARLTQEKAHIARQFMALKCKTGLNNTFNYYLAESVVSSIKTDARGLIAGIDRSAVLRQNVVLPKVEEQQRIGAFFNNLDNLITLHQRKYEKLKTVKKSMLEKMFPRDGSNNPEIRFIGFTDPWEQHKLSEVLTSYTDPVDIPHTGYERLGIRSHAKGTFHSYVPEGHELQTAQMHKVAANKFIVNITFGWEHAVAVTDENDAGKLVSHRFPQFSLSEDLDPKFLKYIILDENFRHHLWLASPGGAGRNRVLNLTEMLQYEICIPNLSEQRQIADVLIRLDNLITLHHLKLEKLKNIKQSLLQNMFV